LVTGFRRSNLALSVRLCRSRQEKLATLDRVVREYETGTILIYCATRRAVEEVAACLGQSQSSVGYYHAGLSDEERRKVHDEFRVGTVRILAATNAFGISIFREAWRLTIRKWAGRGVMADLPPAYCCFMNGMWPLRSTSFSKRRKNPVVQHAPIA